MSLEAGIRRELLGRGSVYTLASVLQAVSVLLVLPLVTRQLDPTAMGEVTAALVVAQLLGLVAALGIPAVITLEYLSPDGNGPERARRLVGATLAVALLIAVGAEITGSWWAQIFSGLDYGIELRFAVWSAAAMAVVAAAQAVLRARRWAFAFLLTGLTATVGGQALGLLALAVVEPTGAAYLAGVFTGTVIGATVGLAVTRPRRPRRQDRPLLAAALRTGLPVVPHSLALFALLAIDRIVVERELGLAAAGRYQVAFLIGGAGLSILAAVNNAWSPIVLDGPVDGRWQRLALSTAELERLVPVVVGAIALASPIAMKIAVPAAYDPTALTRVATIVAASTVPYLWYLAGAHVLFAERCTGALVRITPLVAVANVVTTIILVRTFGLAGAALATVGSYAMLALLIRRHARSLARPPWNRSATRRCVALSAVALAAALLLPVDGIGWIGARLVLLVLAGLAAISGRSAAPIGRPAMVGG